MLVAKIHEGSDDVLHPVFTLEEDVTVRLELATCLRRVLSVCGIERGLEMRHGMGEVHQLDPLRQGVV